MWIKICGVRDAQALEACVMAGADAVGVVLVPSAREVTDEVARELSELSAGRVQTVAVFRKLNAANLARARGLGFDIAQGVVDMSGPVPGDVLPVEIDSPDLAGKLRRWGTRRVLVDGPRFGSGEPADWERIAQVARTGPVVLAGGLSPENVAEALARVQPAGIDVSSGTESAPGTKDPQRIHDFVMNARAAARTLETA
jgi:phosphoribosylanthranilate isomerase